MSGQKSRDVMAFRSKEALIEQIEKDVEQIRRLLSADQQM